MVASNLKYKITHLDDGNYEIERCQYPCCKIQFIKRDDGGYDGQVSEWIDDQPKVLTDEEQGKALTAFLARVMREAGDMLAAYIRGEIEIN